MLFITSSNLHKTSRKLLQECVPDWMYSRFTKITCVLTFSPTSLEQFEIVSQTSLRCCLPGYSSHFAPNKSTQNCHIVIFLPFCWRANCRENSQKVSLVGQFKVDHPLIHRSIGGVGGKGEIENSLGDEIRRAQ